jgi:uncharacterized membrane protein YbhN (UPF0104 family)
MFNILDRIGAVGEFWENLQKGDPVAIVIAVVLGLLAAFVMGVYVYDRKQQKKQSRSPSKVGRGR